MSKTLVKPKTKVKAKTQKPPLYKVILLNDDYTPREFVVLVLKAVFRMNADQAYRVMMTAHQRGACVIAVYARDVAETKAKEATELGKQKGYPLFFTTEPEESRGTFLGRRPVLASRINFSTATGARPVAGPPGKPARDRSSPRASARFLAPRAGGPGSSRREIPRAPLQ